MTDENNQIIVRLCVTLRKYILDKKYIPVNIHCIQPLLREPVVFPRLSKHLPLLDKKKYRTNSLSPQPTCCQIENYSGVLGIDNKINVMKFTVRSS